VRINYLFYIVIQHRNSVQRIADCETVCWHNINIYVKRLFEPLGLIYIYIYIYIQYIYIYIYTHGIYIHIYIYINMYIPRVWVVTVWGIAKCKVST
jgi:hypothetical protein